MSPAEWVMAATLVIGIAGAAMLARMFQEHSVGKHKPRPEPAGDERR